MASKLHAISVNSENDQLIKLPSTHSALDTATIWHAAGLAAAPLSLAGSPQQAGPWLPKCCNHSIQHI
jgi:hypothetical protein